MLYDFHVKLEKLYLWISKNALADYLLSCHYINSEKTFHKCIYYKTLIYSCFLQQFILTFIYIIPIPAPGFGIAGSSDLILATTDSVVNKVDATLVAF